MIVAYQSINYKREKNYHVAGFRIYNDFDSKAKCYIVW